MSDVKLPITVFIATKNEAANLRRCLSALQPAERVVLLDSRSIDETPRIADDFNVELVQFKYEGGYPKKRQWALDNLEIYTPWVLLLDADEVVPIELWVEIKEAIENKRHVDAFLITKEFYFMGRRMGWGGFSHSAVLLFRTGRARFERLLDDDASGLDMEVHERVIVDGTIGTLDVPLVHEDFKGLEAYIARHNRYSTWEARVRYQYLSTGRYGEETIKPKLFGNSQERRRFIKSFVVRMPFEAIFWFVYHYVIRFGFLEGRAGLIAAQIRSEYIRQVHAKIFELSKISNLDRS